MRLTFAPYVDTVAHPLMENYMSDIAKDIRERALAARISIRELFARAGVSNNSLWRWEKGDAPTPLTLGKVMDALEAAEREKDNG